MLKWKFAKYVMLAAVTVLCLTAGLITAYPELLWETRTWDVVWRSPFGDYIQDSVHPGYVNPHWKEPQVATNGQ